MRMRGSAGGAGERPTASSLDRIKASIGFWVLDFGFSLAGTCCRWIGCQHQCSALRLARSKLALAIAVVEPVSCGQGAPISTHFVSAAISTAGSRDFGGI